MLCFWIAIGPPRRLVVVLLAVLVSAYTDSRADQRLETIRQQQRNAETAMIQVVQKALSEMFDIVRRPRMSKHARSTTEASGSTTPEASALADFITIMNEFVLTLSHLADGIRSDEPATAVLLATYVEAIAGDAIDLIRRWPS